MSDFPPPPFEPGEPGPPPSLNVPLPPPLVGEGSPWAPADAENRDRILDWWRMWWRRVFFPWITAFIAYWDAQWDRLAAYLNTWITAADAYIVEHAIAGLSFRTTATDIAGSGTTPVVFTGVDVEHRPVVIGDLVLDQSPDGNFGIVTVVTDATHATVLFLGSLRGPQGIQGIQGIQGEPGAPGVVQALVAGTGITIDDTDPANPIISTEAGGGVVVTIVAGDNITVDATDPANPIVSSAGGGGGVESVTAGTGGITVDNTDPDNPVVSYGGGSLPFAIPVYAGNITGLDPDTYPDSMVYANDDSGDQWLFYSRTPGFWTAVNPTLVAGDGISIDTGADPGYTALITNTVAAAGVVNGVTGGGSVIVEPETGIPNVSVPALDAPSIGHSIVMQNEAPVLGFGNGDAGMAFTSSGSDLTLFLSTGTGSPGVASVVISPTADPGRISFDTIDVDSTTIEMTLDKGGLQWTLANAGFVGLPGWTDAGLAGITDAIIPGSMLWSIDHGAVYVRNSDDTGWLAVTTTPVV